MNQPKKKMGRPSLPDHLKAKPISKAMRVPLVALDAVNEVIKGIKAGAVTERDVIEFIESKKAAALDKTSS